MKYNELVEMWNEESDEQWDSLTEKQKIEFSFDEGRRAGLVQIAEIATKKSEFKGRVLK